MNLPTIEQLMTGPNQPRLHGNGFIQLDIAPDSRLHIWPFPALNAQKVSTQIHNHTFGFESTVILGRTLNVVYDVFSAHALPRASHVIYEARPSEPICPKCEKSDKCLPITSDNGVRCHRCFHAFRWSDTKLMPIEVGERYVQVRRKSVEMLEAGDRYTFPPLEYHEHLPTRCTVATIMRKTAKMDARPRVLCRMGETPDTDFNRHQTPPANLWPIIADVLALAGRRPALLCASDEGRDA